MSGIRFVQSVQDFPCAVSIGGIGQFAPRFALSRWDGAGGLGFDPEETEGGELRAAGRRLLYRGRLRSHRFTIMDGERFEYDLILEREPESNVVSLGLAGAEMLDFFRQPDFLPDPELAGSYAVYGREANGRFGTGKLCHIYAPRIADAAGRSIRGRLDVIGNRLFITIPEAWLAEARYPVVVDPIIGTQTIGANTHWVKEVGEDPERLYCELSIPVNRFQASESFGGTCTAFFYNYYDGDSDVGGKAILYDDGGNYPTARRSANENLIDFLVNASKPAGWRSGTFTTNGSVGAGSYIWFGAHTDSMFYPRFDYGARLYNDFHDGSSAVPTTYPLYSVNNYYDLKLSMYFDYSVPQAFTRSVTQGVAVSDLRRPAVSYSRRTTMTTSSETTLRPVLGIARRIFAESAVSDLLRWTEAFNRSVAEACRVSMASVHTVSHRRSLTQGVAISDLFRKEAFYSRRPTETFSLGTILSPALNIVRILSALSAFSDLLNRMGAYIRAVVDAFHVGMSSVHSVTHIRTLPQNSTVTDLRRANASYARHSTMTVVLNTAQSSFLTIARAIFATVITQDLFTHAAYFIRAISALCRGEDLSSHSADYSRVVHQDEAIGDVPDRGGFTIRPIADSAGSSAEVIRRIFMILRLAGLAGVRDYLLSRFLVSKEEIVIRSRVTLDLEIESKV